MVIVNVTRDDLRDEFAMADEAFALSPISARAVQPSEADYDAIREAFMETSRGRWFLGEYARRNRNADTSMVLDAVARIEETLAAQKKPARDPALDEALAAIRAALDAARIAASAALGDLPLGENLAPVRKGARVIREISWRLREIGADGRICDLIDSQLGAIEEASGKLAAIDPALALSAAFELIEGRIVAFDANEASVTAAEALEEAQTSSLQSAAETCSFAPAAEEKTAASPAPANALDAARGDLAEDDAVEDMAEDMAKDMAKDMAEAQADNVAGEIEVAAGDPVARSEEAEASVETAEAFADPADTYDAQDEAVLDMIAAEMAAPDADEAYVPPGMQLDEDEAAELPEANDKADDKAKAVGAAERTLPAAIADQLPPETVVPSTDPAPESSNRRSPEPSLASNIGASPDSSRDSNPDSSPGSSLGSSLIANGIVQRPRSAKPDPLAPIRRMSQSERIAFFS
jgi:hypothetical protein